MTAQPHIEKLSRLCQIGKEFSSITDIDELLAKISTCSSEVCKTESASIILLDEEKKEMYFKQVSGEMGEIIKRIRIPLNEHSIAGYCILRRESMIVNDVSKNPRHYKKVDKKTKITTKSLLAVPIIWGEKIFGCLEAVNKLEDGKFDEQDKQYLTILAHQAAVALNNVFLMDRLKNFFSYSVEILITSLETLEPDSRGHIIRVARLAVALARKMGFEGKELENIWYGAYFHDVGKLARENAFMSRQEIEKMHPLLGAGLVENIRLLDKCAPYIKNHHERYDGSGFPEGIIGDAIPLGAQIIGLAEDYDEKFSSIQGTMENEEFNKNYLMYAKTRFNPELVNQLEKILTQLRF